MTLPLRRKRPTTRPSFRRMSREGRGLRIEERGAEGRSLLYSLLVMVVATWVPSASVASELVWRSGRSENAAVVGAVTRLTVSQPAGKSTAAGAAESKQASNALRFVRPSSMRVDSAVRQTAFEEESPRLTSGRGSDISRSVVVNREDAAEAFLTAQLPPAAGSGSSGA